MFEQTQGIVLHSVKYSDTALIVTIFTRVFGRVPYIVYGSGKKKSNIRSSILQPLTLVDLVVKHQQGREIQQIKEIKASPALIELPTDPVKNAIALFLSELLFKVLKQPDSDEQLFEFVRNSILLLEDLKLQNGISNFHLLTMVKLTRFLGFYPNADLLEGELSTELCFDLLNGEFVYNIPNHDHYLKRAEANLVLDLMNASYEMSENIHISRSTKQYLLAAMVDYYKLHLSGFLGLKSLSVLEEVFD